MIKCGIYIIKNIKSQKFYVGSSREISRRWDRHRRDLRNGRHHNIYLQRAWNKYGAENFSFEVIKRCYARNLGKHEESIIKQFIESGVLYNISTTYAGGDLIGNNPNKKAIVENITQSIRKRYSNMTSAERRDKYGKSGPTNPNYGNRWSNKQKIRASEFATNRFRDNTDARNKVSITMKKYYSDPKNRKELSERASARRGNQNPFFGKKHSAEAKDKIRKANLGKYRGNQEKPVVIEGVIFRSVSSAARCLGVVPATIINRIRSEKFRGYDYVKSCSRDEK